AAMPKRRASQSGLLFDSHRDEGSGMEALTALQRRLGVLRATLLTADRSPGVREQARAAGVQVLHKPIKPAALRALLAQWRVLRGGGGGKNPPARFFARAPRPPARFCSWGRGDPPGAGFCGALLAEWRRR